jgi:hypothetical protein
MFVFAVRAGADNVKFITEVPSNDQLKQKGMLCLRARSKADAGELTPENIEQEVLFMEVNK